MRRIKNRGKLTGEELIIGIVKSEGSNAERNYMKHFKINVPHINTNVSNNNANVSNNNDVNNNTNDDDDDDKIRDKRSDIRAILSRLRDIVTKNYRKKIKKEVFEIENMKKLSDEEKEKIYDNLVEIINKLNKKETDRYHDCDGLDYHGIRDNTDDDDYCNNISQKFFR